MTHRAICLSVSLTLAPCGTTVADQEHDGDTSPLAAPAPIPTIAYIQAGASPVITSDRPIFIQTPGVDPALLGAGTILHAAARDTLLFSRSDGHVQAFRVSPTPTPLYDRLANGTRPDG